MCDTESIVADLRAFTVETGLPLPAPIYDIAFREWQHAVTDLQTGSVFRILPGWREFTRCWLAERTRHGRPVSAADLAAAMVRSGDLAFPGAAHALACYHLNAQGVAAT